MQAIIAQLKDTLLQPDNMLKLMKVALILIIGFIGLNIIKSLVVHNIRKRTSPQTLMLTRKIIFYSGASIIIFIALKETGVNLGILLGTAGVAGIAIGFASQTSISNIISSLFLLSEKPFEVDDVITVGDKTGIVMSIDLLSVKIRTFANTYIRIPNETIIKSEVTNITRFPIRRLDIVVKVPFDQDTEEVHRVLTEVAGGNPHCLENPAPLYILQNFGESSIEIFFGVWFEKSGYIDVKNSMMLGIKNAFRKEGISLAYPGVRLINAVGPEQTSSDGSDGP